MAKKLNEQYGAENVFAYTFATPRSTYDIFSNNNYNIYNILNTEDKVPMYLSTLINRYGIDEWFFGTDSPAMEQNFKMITGGKV